MMTSDDIAKMVMQFNAENGDGKERKHPEDRDVAAQACGCKS